eukprot:5660353-Pleurochrysis_carterae.AAC.2
MDRGRKQGRVELVGRDAKREAGRGENGEGETETEGKAKGGERKRWGIKEGRRRRRRGGEACGKKRVMK